MKVFCAFATHFVPGRSAGNRRDQSNPAIHLPSARRIVFSHGQVHFLICSGIVHLTNNNQNLREGNGPNPFLKRPGGSLFFTFAVLEFFIVAFQSGGGFTFIANRNASFGGKEHCNGGSRFVFRTGFHGPIRRR